MSFRHLNLLAVSFYLIRLSYPVSLIIRLRYGNPNTAGGHVALFVVYVVLGTLMAGLAVIFVKMIAPYACGSGIPEVKTILSGFVMHGYLGFGTLLGKTSNIIVLILLIKMFI